MLLDAIIKHHIDIVVSSSHFLYRHSKRQVKITVYGDDVSKKRYKKLMEPFKTNLRSHHQKAKGATGKDIHKAKLEKQRMRMKVMMMEDM